MLSGTDVIKIISSPTPAWSEAWQQRERDQWYIMFDCYFLNKLLYRFLLQNVGPGHLRQYPPNPAMVMKSIISMNSPNGMLSRNQLTTINQSQLNAQLSLNMAGPNITHTSPSPPASKSATPSPSSSINEDDQEEGNRVSKVRSRSVNKRPAVVEDVFLNFFISIVAGHWWEATRPHRSRKEAQDSKEEEEEGSQWASEASVSLRPVLQRHPGCY